MKQRGFTLIEILVAIFILAIISAVMMRGLQTVIKTKENLSRNSDALTQLTFVMDFMQSDFAHIANRPITNASGAVEPPITLLADSTQSLVLTRDGVANPLLEHRSNLMRIAYRVAEGNLIRATWPTLDPVQGTVPRDRILLTGITSFTWEFVDSKGQRSANWPSATASQEVLPRAVIVNIGTKQGSFSQTFLVVNQLPVATNSVSSTTTSIPTPTANAEFTS